MVITLAVFLTLLVGVGLLWWWLYLTKDRLPEIEPPTVFEIVEEVEEVPHVHGPECVHREAVDRVQYAERSHVQRVMK